MAYLIAHFYEGGTEDQYNAALETAHPGGSLPAGPTFTPQVRRKAGFSW